MAHFNIIYAYLHDMVQNRSVSRLCSSSTFTRFTPSIGATVLASYGT